MTTTAQLRDLTVAALVGKTAAGPRVYSARSWPTAAASYPLLYVKTPHEERESLGRNGAPQFTTTATIRVIARVQNPSKTDDASSFEAEQALEAIKVQIEQAVINNPAIMALLQQFPFVKTDSDINSEGSKVLGELQMDIGMEFYEGPESFYPVDGDPIDEITVTADLYQPADPSGTYANPPFPTSVVPAPRDHGPDGRAEGGLDITLPQ